MYGGSILLLMFVIFPTWSIVTSQCYVGVQLGTNVTSYKVVACATPSSSDECSVVKIGNTFEKGIICKSGNRRHVKTLDNFYSNRLRFNSSQESITVGNYTCSDSSDSGSYECICTNALCNEQLPISLPAPPITTNPLRCYVGAQIGNVDGYELTNCLTGSQWCVAQVKGRTIVAGCSSNSSNDDPSIVCPSVEGCTKTNYGSWYCCCNSSNGCNKDIAASIHDTPPNDTDFQCSVGIGLSVAGIDGYKTMACTSLNNVSNACNTATSGGYTEKDCDTNNGDCANAGIVDRCVTLSDQTNLCCCQSSKCNVDSIELQTSTSVTMQTASSSLNSIETQTSTSVTIPTTSSSLKTIPTTTNIIYTALVCFAAITAMLAY